MKVIDIDLHIVVKDTRLSAHCSKSSNRCLSCSGQLAATWDAVATALPSMNPLASAAAIFPAPTNPTRITAVEDDVAMMPTAEYVDRSSAVVVAFWRTPH